jgi:hypothetical protein
MMCCTVLCYLCGAALRRLSVVLVSKVCTLLTLAGRLPDLSQHSLQGLCTVLALSAARQRHVCITQAYSDLTFLLLLLPFLQEAAYHGVPVIGIPLMIGHTELVTHARDHGRGLLVTKEALLAGDAGPLTAALKQIVSNSSFKQQVSVACSA